MAVEHPAVYVYWSFSICEVMHVAVFGVDVMYGGTARSNKLL